jgi:hypothetical protein
MTGFTEEEIAFANAYRSKYKTSVLTNIELRQLHRDGYVFDQITGEIISPTRSAKIDFPHKILNEADRTTNVKLDTKDHVIKDPQVNEDIKRRNKSREATKDLKAKNKEKADRGEQVTKAEIDLVNKQLGITSRASEHIAVAVVDDMMKAQGFLIYYPLNAGFPGAGDLDRIYIRKVGESFEVVEVKGGASKLGSRKVVHVPSLQNQNLRAEQGSDVYFVDIVLNMISMEGTQMEDVGNQLREALFAGDVNYLYFHQDFSDIGNLLSPKFQQFDIAGAAKYLKQ